MPTYNKVVVIEVSTVCNLSCPFCAHDSRLKIPRYTLEHESLQAFINVVGEYSATKKEPVLISWLGGEPFINKSVLPLTEKLKNNYPLYFSATTNGTKLSEQTIREHIKHYYSELTVSVDGFSAFHDKMRGRTGLFDEIKKNIRLLVDEAPELKIRINTVLMRNNFDLFHELCVEVADWGVKEITFNQLGGRDRPEFHPENRLSAEQVKDLPKIVSAIQAKISHTEAKLIFSEGYFRRISASATGEKLPILDCGPGSYYMFVNAHGKISPCSFTIDEYGMDISSIQTVAAFEELPSVFHQKKTLKQAYHCHDCPNTNVHGKFS